VASNQIKFIKQKDHEATCIAVEQGLTKVTQQTTETKGLSTKAAVVGESLNDAMRQHCWIIICSFDLAAASSADSS